MIQSIISLNIEWPALCDEYMYFYFKNRKDDF